MKTSAIHLSDSDTGPADAIVFCGSHSWVKENLNFSVKSRCHFPPQSKFMDPPELHLRTQQDERPQARHESTALPSDNLVGL